MTECPRLKGLLFSVDFVVAQSDPDRLSILGFRNGAWCPTLAVSRRRKPLPRYSGSIFLGKVKAGLTYVLHEIAHRMILLLDAD
jgi:hypothetical protein